MGVDASVSAREAAPVQALSPAGGSSGAASGLSPKETFAALDAEAAPGAPTWTHAGPRQAEAGFKDPALGWVGVRAGLNGGSVHVSLVPGSELAAQELGKHMDGLSGYLTEQHMPVGSLAMDAPSGRNAGATAGDGPANGMQQSPDQGAQQGSNRQPDPSEHRTGTESGAVAGLRTASPAAPAPVPVADSGGSRPDGVGRHISVVA